MKGNPYIPFPVKIKSVRDEAPDTKTFTLELKGKGSSFKYLPGQFIEVSYFGYGEAPISITSSPSQKGILDINVKAVGKLTRKLHELKKGDSIFIRGPYGNSFPLNKFKGRDLLFVGGGIGLAPLRSVINEAFHKRRLFGKIHILYGARTPEELVFKKELKEWQKNPGTQVLLTVDAPIGSWTGNVGVVTTLYDKLIVDAKRTTSFVCGPPVMIPFAIQGLIKRYSFDPKDIYTTLERLMKCGIGKCAHCNIGHKYVCIDGPVFTLSELTGLVEKF